MVKRIIFIGVVLISLSLVNSIFAQGTTSRFTGTVTDSTGAAIPEAKIVLTNEGTNVSLTTVTGGGGSYTFDLILPGTYTIAVERQGFKKFVSTGNVVNINQPATVNVVLETGGIEETVTVKSAVEEVQTSTSGNVGSTIEQRTVESLPIVGTRGRNPLSLLNFQPGIVVGSNTGGGIHVHGSRDRAFNFTLDGIDINESTAGGSNFTPLRTNPDSLQEFQVVTSNATAELGRSSGAQVTLVTRAGTNDLHGTLFEFYQTPRFIANEFEFNLLEIPRRQFVQHIFGGSVGGPLVNPFGEGTPTFQVLRDKAFFFVNLQFLRASETRLARRTVYTQAARNGIFRYVQNGRNLPAGNSAATIDANGNPTVPNCPGPTPTSPCIATYNIANNPTGIGLDPRISSIINSTPLPNDFGRGDGLNTAGFNFVAPSSERQYDLTTRLDFKITDSNQFYVRYSQGAQDTISDIGNGGLQPFPGLPGLVDTVRRPKNLAANLRSALSSRVSNEFIYGINDFSFTFGTPQPDPNLPFELNLVTDVGTNFSFNARSFRTHQFVDNITFDFAPHTIKTGVNLRFGRQFDNRSSVGGTGIEPNVNFSRTVNSNFTAFNLPSSGINSSDFNTLRSQINDFLGRVGTISQAFVATPDGNTFEPAGTRYNFTSYYPEYDFFVQDTWKARSNLTFDLGLRYEAKLSPSSEGIPILRPDQPISVDAPQSNTLRYEEGKLFENDLNNLGPSVGVAWDPFKNGKTSVRANYRLSYDRFPTFVFASSIFQNTPGNNTGVFDTSFGQSGGLLRNGLPTLAPSSTPNVLRQPSAFGSGTLTVIDRDLVFPEVHQYFVGVQREIGFKSVLEINYIGKRGEHLFGGYNANQTNLSATDPRCGSQTFLQSFIQAQNAANATMPNCIASLLTGGTANGSSAAFRSQFSSELSTDQNAVASAAQTLAQRGGSTALTANGFSPFFFKKYPQFSTVNVLDSNDYSRYNALEVILKRRISSGIGFQLGYTLSKSEDTRSFDPTFSTVRTGTSQAASSTPFDINNRDLNFAPSDFDRRHVFQATYVAELPFGRNRKFFSEIPKALDLVIGGWQLAGTFLFASGRPFTVFAGRNTFSNTVSSTANCSGCPRDLGQLIQENGTGYFFSADQRALFSIPDPGELGNTGRNYFIGPRQFQTDASLSKKFRFTERFNFELRVDAQNLTNTPSFGLPIATVSSGALLGRIRDNVTSFSRRIQFSGRINF
ncbi:MAG: TonB-dependent receptor [Acidobacteriota bacterium]|nr:TonB-dependent receptor [Acidobacteriota bacterium]